VLYLNGIAIAVIELKRSSVELADGVRQLITNQEEIFNKGFFSTVQLVLAGSDSQGLRYGTTGTPEQFFVEWKDEAPAEAGATQPPGRCSTGRWRSCATRRGCWT
jgi:type I restriction enzyme R subunit